MIPDLQIKLSPQAEKIVAGLQSLPARMVVAISSAMTEAGHAAVTRIQRYHLTGDKGHNESYLPEEHRLVVRSDRLRGSAWSTDAQQISATKIQGAIGSNVIYAAIHEFGGQIHHEAREMTLRHRTDARGNLVKQLANSNLLVFARADHKRVRETKVKAKAYDIEMPERAPFRTGISETMPTYTKLISTAIVAEWTKTK